MRKTAGEPVITEATGGSSVHSGLISSARLQAPCGWGCSRIQKVTGKREGVESESFILNPGVPLTGYAWARRLLFFFFLKDLIF